MQSVNGLNNIVSMEAFFMLPMFVNTVFYQSKNPQVLLFNDTHIFCGITSFVPLNERTGPGKNHYLVSQQLALEFLGTMHTPIDVAVLLYLCLRSWCRVLGLLACHVILVASIVDGTNVVHALVPTQPGIFCS